MTRTLLRMTREGMTHSLILDVKRTRIKRQYIGRRHQTATVLPIILIKEFEACVLHGILVDVPPIRLSLHPRRTPAVHVDDDLNARIELDALVAREHIT